MEKLLGPEVDDPEEECFLLFCQSIPSRDLGMVDSKTDTLELSVATRELVIHQSLSLLSSNRKDGTTGSTVWGVTPRFAEWIISPDNFLHQYGTISPEATVLELGCGVAGIVAIMLAPIIRHYVATDQEYVMKLLRRNIAENLPIQSKLKKMQNRTPSKNITLLPLDWETSSLTHLPTILESFSTGLSQQKPASPGLDAIIACDCIYNEALIEPFVSTCAEICRLRQGISLPPTICIVAQQLRSPDVLEAWLSSFHQTFHVWRVPDQLLTKDLQEDSGFVVHIGVLRQSTGKAKIDCHFH